MKKLNNILKLANYFYELNNFTKLADEQIDLLFKDIEEISPNYELKGDLTFLKVLFDIFSKNGNGFNELNQSILALYSEYVSSYEEDNEDLDDEYMDQLPEDISKLSEFLNVLKLKIKNMPTSNKSFTNDEVMRAKQARSQIISLEDPGDPEENEYETENNYLTDEQIAQEDRKYLEENLGLGDSFETVKGDAEDRKAKQSYSMVIFKDGKELIDSLKAEKADVLASKKYYSGLKGIDEAADNVVSLIDQLIPYAIKINDMPDVIELKDELKTLLDLQYTKPEIINRKES